MTDQQETEAQTRKEYSLHANVLDINPELPLSEDEFQNLKQAKACLNAAMALEENYDLLISNYRELELEAISAAVTDMTTEMPTYEDSFETRTSINRRVINLLSAARMYLDQYPQLLKRIGADPKTANEASSNAYDNTFEYRFLEALRNHAQHAGLAVHGVATIRSWLPPDEPRQLQFSVTPYALKSVLEESAGFKKAVLDECPDRVNIISAARIHVGGISSVHKEVRALIAPFVQKARRLFEGAIARHEEEANKRFLGLAALAKENGEAVEKVAIFLDWDDVRQKLEKRNCPVENLGKRFIKSETKGRAKK